MNIQPASSPDYVNLLNYANDLWGINYQENPDGLVEIKCGNDIVKVNTRSVNEFGRYTFLHTKSGKNQNYRKVIEHRNLEFGIFLTTSYYSNKEYRLPTPSIGDWIRFKQDMVKYKDYIAS